jgi:small-conductance mechanosensitive channel
MQMNFLKNKLGKKYNILLIITLWTLFIIIHYFFWNLIINFSDNNSLLILYILFIPVLLSFLIYKLSNREATKDRKVVIIFGIIIPLLIYYVCLGAFVYLATQALKNARFSL